MQRALEPLLACIESVSEQINEYNERIDALAQQSYPQVALLKQIKGVGTLIALTFLLTLEHPHRPQRRRWQSTRTVLRYAALPAPAECADRDRLPFFF